MAFFFSHFLLNLIMMGTQFAAMLQFVNPSCRRSRFAFRVSACAVALVFVAAAIAARQYRLNRETHDFLLSSFLFAAVIAGYLVCCKDAPTRAIYNISSGILVRLAASSLANFPLALLPAAHSADGWLSFVTPLMHLLTTVLLLIVLDITIVGEIRSNRDFLPGRLQIGIMAALICMILSMFGSVQSSMQALLWHGFRAAFCILMLMLFYVEWKQARILAQNALENRIGEEKLRHYEDLGNVVRAMNIKAHDLRHQIRTLKTGSVVTPEVISELTETVQNYESYIRTGSDTLDLLLTEATMRCERAGIDADFRVDGTCLSFMTPTDLNALFGNAIDNAIEYLSALPEDDRLFWVVCGKTDGFVRLRFENRLLSPVALKNGVPQTTKTDTLSHGFGTQSIRQVAEKYGGSASFSAEDEVFTVCIVLPAAD